MKYLLFSLLVTSAMVSQAQETDTIPRLPWPSDSIWHLKGTHKKVIRQARVWFIHDNRWNDTLHKWIGPPPEVQRYKYDTTDEAFARKLDTIDVWRMVCDTTPGFGHGVKMMGITEVRESHNEAEGVIDPGFYLGKAWHDYWRHLKYLTAGGHHLPKGMVVIETDAYLANQEPEYAVTPDPPPPPDTSHVTWGNIISYISLDTAMLSTGITTVVGGGLTWKPYPPTVTIDPSWLPRRLRKRYERYLKSHKTQ